MTIAKAFMVVLLAIACVSLAQAQTTVRITGSTAYRGNTHNAILHIYDSGVNYCYTGTSFSGASQAIFQGTIGGSPVTIKTSWTGSEAGIQTVAASLSIPFLVQAAPTAAPGGNAAQSCTSTELAVPDVALSDTFQSSSAFLGLYRGIFYPVLTESPNSPVGIVPFKFLANNGAPAGLTNITSQQARALFGAGTLSLAFFTNNHLDESKTVIATGRDAFSGTRLIAMAETGLGPLASVKHWEPLDSAGNLVRTVGTPIHHFTPWRDINIVIFNGGYSSGGDLSKMMANTCPANFTVVSYAGVADADNNALPNGAIELSYNGVTLGNTGGNYNNATVLTEGKYTFWGYEHLYYRSNTPVEVRLIADALALQLQTVDAQVLLSSMKVSRTTDGSVIFPSYSLTPPPQM
jgi:hypothetical protein